MADPHPISGPPVVWKAAGDTSSRRLRAARAAVDAHETLEKIIARSNLKPIAFLEGGLAVAKSVAHITLADGGMATGFLITKDLLLTNAHVFPDADSTHRIEASSAPDVRWRSARLTAASSRAQTSRQ
jgi:hypothetical protein